MIPNVAIMTTNFYSDILAPSGSYKFYVNGEWKESTSGKTVPILNPTTNEVAFTVQGKDDALLLNSVQCRFRLRNR